MNGVLIGDQPSLFTCDEMNDDAYITILETKTTKRWRDIRKAYDDWVFGEMSDTNIE